MADPDLVSVPLEEVGVVPGQGASGSYGTSWEDVAAREDSAVLCFPSRRGLTPRGSLECNPEILVFP